MNNKLYILISEYNKHTICAICGSNETYIQIRNGRGTPQWNNYKDGKICSRCHHKLYEPKEKKKLRNKNNSKYRLDYCGINLLLSFQLPRNICEVCGKTKKEIKIDRHHYFYIRIMPWACTISICGTCHQNITHKGRIKGKYRTGAQAGIHRQMCVELVARRI